VIDRLRRRLRLARMADARVDWLCILFKVTIVAVVVLTIINALGGTP
jgi:hypothetical protein